MCDRYGSPADSLNAPVMKALSKEAWDVLRLKTFAPLPRAPLRSQSAGGDRQSAGMKRSVPARRVGLPVSLV
jgi:hypothetical protein